MATTTLTEARQLLGDIVGDLVVSAATSNGAAGGTTIVDTALRPLSFDEDDFYNNQVAIITAAGGAAPEGEERRISDFVASTGTLTLYGTGFSAQVDSGDSYEIHKIWTPTEKRRALNWAARRGYPQVARNIIDGQITTVADIWSYRLGDFGTGANVTYPSATTLTDTDKSWITNQHVGYRVESGANSGTVTSNTADTLTLTANWSPATPSAAASYTIIHPIQDIYEAKVQVNTDTATYPYKSYPFEPREHEGTRTIQFFPGARPPDGNILRLQGRGYLSDFTSTESSVVEIEENHIDALLFLAAHFLFRRTPTLSASQDREFYREEAARYLAMWEIEKKKLAVRSFPVKLWSSQMTVHRGGDELSELAMFDTPNPP